MIHFMLWMGFITFLIMTILSAVLAAVMPFLRFIGALFLTFFMRSEVKSSGWVDWIWVVIAVVCFILTIACAVLIKVFP